MNTPKVVLYLQDDETYEGQHDDNAITMAREFEGESPNGNPLDGVWVLRVDGEYIDHDRFRTDLARRNNLQLELIMEDGELTNRKLGRK